MVQILIRCLSGAFLVVGKKKLSRVACIACHNALNLHLLTLWDFFHPKNSKGRAHSSTWLGSARLRLSRRICRSQDHSKCCLCLNQEFLKKETVSYSASLSRRPVVSGPLAKRRCGASSSAPPARSPTQQQWGIRQPLDLLEPVCCSGLPGELGKALLKASLCIALLHRQADAHFGHLDLEFLHQWSEKVSTSVGSGIRFMWTTKFHIYSIRSF